MSLTNEDRKVMMQLHLDKAHARHVPMEIKVEYRHPVLVPTSGALNPKEIYLGTQIYFGSTFKK